MFLLLNIPSHTSVAVADSMLNDRFIPITTSYRVLVAVERGGFICPSNNPSTYKFLQELWQIFVAISRCFFLNFAIM